MKKPVSKSEIRNELQRETESFLRRGGHVKEIPQGISGRDPQEPPLYLNRRLFVEPRAPRTHIPEVVAAIEARRLDRFRRTPSRKRRPAQPRRRVIYDDFGEPLRRVWQEE